MILDFSCKCKGFSGLVSAFGYTTRAIRATKNAEREFHAADVCRGCGLCDIKRAAMVCGVGRGLRLAESSIAEYAP